MKFSLFIVVEKIKMFVYIIFGFFIIYYLTVANWSNPEPINGIYSKEGPLYPLKYVIFYILVLLNRVSTSGNK